MKRIFNVLSTVVLLSALAACEAKLPPIVINPDPAFDKYGAYTVNTISIYDTEETVITVSRIHGLSKEVEMTIGIDEALLATYNELNGTSYELMPAEFYTIPSSVKLDRTIKEVECPVVMKPKALVAASGLAKANTYAIPLSITQSTMDLDDQGATAEVILLPNVVDPNLVVALPEVNAELDFIRGNPVDQNLVLNAEANFTTVDPSKVTYVPVPEAVEKFNKANGTSYELLPAAYYSIAAGVLDAETMNFATDVTFSCHKIESQNDAYLLPLAMQSADYGVKQNEPLYVIVELTQLRVSIANGGSLVTNYKNSGSVAFTLNAPLASDFNINLKYDSSKVAAYNQANGTDYTAVDPSKLTITAAAVPAGTYTANVDFNVEWKDFPYDSGSKMLLPLTIDESVLMPGTVVDENNTVYMELVKTVSGVYSVEPITPDQPAAIQSYWTALMGSTVWVADGKTPVNSKVQQPSGKGHKYVIIYGGEGKWNDGLLYFNIDFTTEIEGMPGCYPLVDFRDRVGGHDKILTFTNYFDSAKGEFRFDFVIEAASAPGIKADKPLEDPSHIPGFGKYGRLYNRQ